MSLLMLPGLGGSGEAHWQTLWEHAEPDATRFGPSSWDAPDLADWCAALDRAVAALPEPPLLVAHSLGTLLLAHWAAMPGRLAVRGAFLVAMPDPDGAAFPPEAPSFRKPVGPAPTFPTLVVASSDDPYAAPAFAQEQAARWGAGFVLAGSLGHINADSGLGDWPQGRGLLEAFRAGIGGRALSRSAAPPRS